MDLIPLFPDLRIVAADHPSLDRDVDRFLDELSTESRRFGPTARTNPKPFRSLVASLGESSGFRLAAIECGHMVALVRVDLAGVVWLAVHVDHRGRGVGTQLVRIAVERAMSTGHPQLVLQSTRRSSAALRVSQKVGCRVIERERGRTELTFDLERRRSA